MFEPNNNAPLSTSEDADYFQKANSNISNNTYNAPTREFSSQEDNYESCPNCSRTFFAGRLKLHMKSCKDGKPQAKSIKVKTIIEKSTDDSSDQSGGNRIVSLGSETYQSKMVAHYRTSSMPNRESPTPGYQPEYNVPTAESEDELDNKERPKAEDGRVGCLSCGRFFLEDRIAKHEKACKKSSKKRPVFDTTQQRAIVETDAIVKKSSSESVKTKKVVQKEKIVKEVQGEKEEVNKKTPAWKAQHENFIENIRFNRKLKEMQARGEDTSHLVVPTIVNDTYVSCSYCFRRFAPATAERHIPKCKNTFNRPKPPKNLHLEDIEKCDRSKSQISPKKGTSVRKGPEAEYKEPVTPTKSIGKIISNRSPTQEPQYDDRSQATDSPKGNSKLPQFDRLKGDSRAFMKKVPSMDNARKNIVLPGIRRQESGENNLTAYDISMNKNSREMRSQSPPGGKKIFTEPIRKKEELLQHYQSLFMRAGTYATEECPYCYRKFSHHAAERHIPVCKSLPTRNVRKTGADEVVEVMSAEKKRPKKMYFTGFNPKMMYTKGGVDDSIYPKSSHNGSLSTGYDHFFGEKRVKKNERRPLPLVKSNMETKEVILEKPPLLRKLKPFSSAAHFCTSCGSRLAKFHNFCGNCGHRKQEL